MIVLKVDETKHLSIVTTQECSVTIINLKDFGLFSDFYSEQFKKLGFLACSFKNGRLRLVIDVKNTIKFMNDCLLEEL